MRKLLKFYEKICSKTYVQMYRHDIKQHRVTEETGVMAANQTERTLPACHFWPVDKQGQIT